MALDHNFLRYLPSICFCRFPGFHISSFAVFQVWLLIYYLYFSNKADKFCFFLESLFPLCYLSKEDPDREPFINIRNMTANNANKHFPLVLNVNYKLKLD